MWMFEQRGFTSAVAYSPKADKASTLVSSHKKIALESDNPEGGWLLLRARLIDDLEVIEKILDIDLHIDTDPSADYTYRALISRDDMKRYMVQIVDDIDYGSHFKEVAEARSSHGYPRHHAMMSVWSAMAELQPYSPYTGKWRGYLKNSPKVTSKVTSTSGKASGKITPETSVFGSGKDWGSEVPYGDEEADWIDSNGDGYSWTPQDGWKSVAKGGAKKEIEVWSPVNYWFNLENFRDALAEPGVTLGTIPSDDIEGMTDEVMEMWLEGLDKFGPDHVLSESEIESLCTSKVLAENTTKGN